MSLYVPERERSGGMLDAVIPLNDFHRSKKGHFSQLALAPVPDQDTLEVAWNDNGKIDIQGQDSQRSKSPWQINCVSDWSSGQEAEDGVTPSKPDTPKGGNLLEAGGNGSNTAPNPVHNIDVDNDEMVSWLQYPLDNPFCSDFFGEIQEANTQLLRESFTHGSTKTLPRTNFSGAPGNDAGINRETPSDSAMLLGAGRVSGLLPQGGVEAFNKVRSLHSLQQYSSLPRCPQPLTPNSSSGSSLFATNNLTFIKASAPTLASPSNHMLPPKTQRLAPVLNSQNTPQPSSPGSMNFSHFSRPAAMVKANLHSLVGINCGPPPSTRVKQQHNSPVVRPIMEACTSSSSIAESTTAGQGPSGSYQEVKTQPAVLEREQNNGIEESRCPSAPCPSPTKDSDCVVSEGNFRSTPPDQETCRLSGVTNGAVLASSEKGASHGTQHPDVQEPTITSSSGGYGTSIEPLIKVRTSNKRKFSEREETEFQIEDGEDESVDTKHKPITTGRGSTTKRSRAAEVHNQSERRRRDRINEKMRALQELIPNSNKTDKASMLDEAIDYLKILQLQLQMMSIRTGMTLPPMVMPPGIQHMQIPQMAAMPSMGMVQMGLGMGMMEMAAQRRTRMPMQSHTGPPLNVCLANTSSMADVHGLRYQQAGVLGYNTSMSRQHQPMQTTKGLDLDKCNAYMLQQHQLQFQQQQLQQHQLHQHQQHLQHHQQAPNMGGGPLQ